jgi:hypothetical protein
MWPRVGPERIETNWMKNYSKQDMSEGLDYYFPETRVFPQIAQIDGPRKLKKQDVLLILKWKLSRIKKSNDETVSDSKLRLINQCVEKAGRDGREVDALNELDEVPGIGLATATAILTVCYPDKFTIIDRRVLEILGLSPTKAEGWSAERYFQEYVPRVKEQSAQWGCTLRDADRALWGLSVRDDVNRIIG